MNNIYLDLCELRDLYWKLYRDEHEDHAKGRGSERALWTAYGKYVGVITAITTLQQNGRI